MRTRSHSSRTAVRAKRTRNTLRVYSNKPPRCFAPHRLDADDILGRVSSVIVSETQQLSWPMPSCPTRHCTPRVKLLGGSRQPMAGRLATTTTVRDKCFRSVHFVCCEQGFKRRATVDDERQLPRVSAHIAIIISSRSLADASSSTTTTTPTSILTATTTKRRNLPRFNRRPPTCAVSHRTNGDSRPTQAHGEARGAYSNELGESATYGEGRNCEGKKTIARSSSRPPGSRTGERTFFDERQTRPKTDSIETPASPSTCLVLRYG